MTGRLAVDVGGRPAELVASDDGLVLRVRRFGDALALRRNLGGAFAVLRDLARRLDVRCGIQIGRGRVHRVLPTPGLVVRSLRPFLNDRAR